MRLGFLGPFKSDFDVFVASARVFPNRHDDLDQPGLLRTYFGDFCSPGPFNKHLVFIVVFDYLLLPFPRPTQRLGYSQIAFRYRVLIEVKREPQSAYMGVRLNPAGTPLHLFLTPPIYYPGPDITHFYR